MNIISYLVRLLNGYLIMTTNYKTKNEAFRFLNSANRVNCFVCNTELYFSSEIVYSMLRTSMTEKINQVLMNDSQITWESSLCKYIKSLYKYASE